MNHPALKDINGPRIFNLGNNKERIEYFKLANTTEAFFSYLSGPIFKRETWNKFDDIPKELSETCWIVAVHLLYMIQYGLTVYYLKEIFINKRNDNDSFTDKGMVNRYKIAVIGFRTISDYIFGHDSLEAFHIRRTVRKDLSLKHMLNLKLSCANQNDEKNLKELDRVVSLHYSDKQASNIIKLLIFRHVPISLYTHVKSIYKILKKDA